MQRIMSLYKLYLVQVWAPELYFGQEKFVWKGVGFRVKGNHEIPLGT